jgi:uncharacterized protein (TIGR00375 family)
MRAVADLHTHSRYSRATSRNNDINGLSNGAKIKGIDIIATGDFTHPQYFNEIKSLLKEDGSGIYDYNGVKFIISGEISLIYGKRRMHHLVLSPNLEIASQINDALGSRGNLKSDGRPILGLSSPEFAEILFSISDEVVVIPAHCLLPGTTIHTNPGTKPIDDINIGDYVYTHKGRTRKVTKTFNRLYKGTIYSIVPWYFTLGVTTTSEHPIYAIKTAKNCSWTKGLICKPTKSHKRICYQHFYKNYKPEWILAKDLEKGDVLLYPRFNNEIIDVQKINMKNFVDDLEDDVWIEVDRDFCRLIGYYLAEGYTNSRDAIAFTFHSNEDVYIGDVKQLMKSIFNVECKYGKTKGDLIFYSRLLMKFFSNLFYSSTKEKRAFTKYIPQLILQLPQKKQVEVFRGWWRGDKGSTSSKNLSNQMKIICLRLGIMPSIRIDSRENHKLRGNHKLGSRKISASYDNFILDKLSFFEDKFNLLKEDEFRKFDYKLDKRHGWIDENYMYLPIREIAESNYEGQVYNLEVEDDNSYLTDFAIVHNCWTPWFSVFGSQSGVDTIEEAFEDKADKIFALETGLSSDPAMNWMISSLDKYSLVSNSDAHSLDKLGREANLFDLSEVTYSALINAIKTRKGFVKTYEFYPEEGKYHYDGHRKCNICWSPWESKKHGDICTVCRKKVTVGVLHRVADLADRKEGFKPENAVPFQYIVPLKTIISKTIRKGENTIAVRREYDKLIQYFGNEFAVFEAKEEQIRLATDPAIADSIMKVNKGNIQWIPGHDGVFGELILDLKGAPKGAADKKQMSLDEF